MPQAPLVNGLIFFKNFFTNMVKFAVWGKMTKEGPPTPTQIDIRAPEELPEEVEEDLRDLIEEGRERGFLAIEEVVEIIPDLDEEETEEVLHLLEENEIELVEESLDGFEEVEDIEAYNGFWGESNVDLYFREAASTPLLTREEEVNLAKRIERGKKARQRIADSKDLDRKEKERLSMLVTDGKSAREDLIKANLRLVISVAKKYRGRGLNFLDLIQEGNIGLMRGIKTFEYERGYKFSTYATWWIKQTIQRAVAENGRTIRVPYHVNELIGRMYRVKHRLTQELGREPEDEELTEELGITADKFRLIKRAATYPLSLETPLSNEKDSTELGDLIEDKDTPSPAEETEMNLLRERVSRLLELDVLTVREAQVLALRKGLNGQEKTLQQVGDMLGVTRERVRQLESKALRKLRRVKEAEDVYKFIEEK